MEFAFRKYRGKGNKKDWCIPQHASLFYSWICSSRLRKFIKMRNITNNSPAGVPQTSTFPFCSCPIPIQSLLSMTDRILKVYNNLFRVSLAECSTKDEKHRKNQTGIISSPCFFSERGGLWKTERKNSFVSLCLPLGSPRCFWALIISFVVSKTSRVAHVYRTVQSSTRSLMKHGAISHRGKKHFSQRKSEIQWWCVCECVC